MSARHESDIDLELESLEPPTGAPVPLDRLPLKWGALSTSTELDIVPSAPIRGSQRPAPAPAPQFETGPFDSAAFEPTSFEKRAFEPAAFEPASFEERAFEPAPGANAVFVPLGADEAPTTLYDDAFRICLRLTGVASLAHELAGKAVRGTESPYAVVANAVALCLEADLANEDHIPFHQHRTRIRRDLARHSQRDQAILALRHLVVTPAGAVAERFGMDEGLVREVSSAWRPADSRGDSAAMLRGIDSWISSDLRDKAPAPTTDELSHLDDTRS